MAKVISYKKIGNQQTYDLEVNHNDHQFYLASGLLTSNSHAVAYAIDSYYAGWLHTHHEKEWLATVLQSENNSPKGIEKAISEIKSYGYKFAASDVNYSGTEWNYSYDIESFVPPLSSVKGVGTAAMEEIMVNRPYKSLKAMLYDTSGVWRHSKMNKTAFRSLCKVEAFNSLLEMRNGTIKNHRQLLAILTEEKNYESLRKSEFGLTKTQVTRAIKKGEQPDSLLDRLIDDYQKLPDWTRVEKINNYMETVASVNSSLMFPKKLIDRVQKKNIDSIFSVKPSARGVGWFCITDIIAKVTKNGKPFFRLKITDNNSNTAWLRVWGLFKDIPELYTLWVGDVHNDPNWGMSTSVYKLRKVTAYD